MADMTDQVLRGLNESSPLLSNEAFPNASFVDLKAALDRLSLREMVQYETLNLEEVLLEPEGEQIVTNGSHEARVFEALRSAVEGLTVQELEKTIGDKTVTKLGQGKAFKDKWITKTKGTSLPPPAAQGAERSVHPTNSPTDGKFKAATDSIKDTTQTQLQEIKDTRACPDAKALTELRKRKLVRTQKIINFKIQKGKSFALEIQDQPTDFTTEMYKAWQKANKKTKEGGAEQQESVPHAQLKPYNFNAP